MKKCVTPAAYHILTVAAAIACAAMAAYAFWVWRYRDHSTIMLFPVALFSVAAFKPSWNLYQMKNWGFYYNEEKIIFVLSRRDRREFRWDELQKAKEDSAIDICCQSLPGIWHFYFPEKKKIKHILAVPRMAGYDEFIAMLKKKNVPAHEADGGIVYDKKWADEVFHQITGEPLYKKDKRNQK